MEVFDITSKDNEKIKFLKKLNQKKYREQYSSFLVENFKTITDAQQAGYRFESLFVTDDFFSKNMKVFSSMGFDKLFKIDNNINKVFSNLDTPSGVCAVYKKQNKPADFSKPIIYLNGINDPGNLGAIIRSAIAFGLDNIIVDEKCADIFNSKTINAAKDAIFKINISYDKNFDLIKELKGKMKIFSTCLEKGKGMNVLRGQKNFCLVLGSEAHGVDEKIINQSDDCIKIKMSNNIDSLNVSSAASIIFHYYYNLTK